MSGDQNLFMSFRRQFGQLLDEYLLQRAMEVGVWLFQ
jgi:hypothetical protein